MLIEAKRFLSYAASETISEDKTGPPAETRAGLARHDGGEPGS